MRVEDAGGGVVFAGVGLLVWGVSIGWVRGEDDGAMARGAKGWREGGRKGGRSLLCFHPEL